MNIWGSVAKFVLLNPSCGLDQLFDLRQISCNLLRRCFDICIFIGQEDVNLDTIGGKLRDTYDGTESLNTRHEGSAFPIFQVLFFNQNRG